MDKMIGIMNYNNIQPLISNFEHPYFVRKLAAKLPRLQLCEVNLTKFENLIVGVGSSNMGFDVV